jgi:hypothetical protein
MTVEIECLCGAIRVQLDGEPVAHFYCHCDDCQAVHGAPCIPVAMYRANAVKIIHGAPSTWKLRTTRRTTCPECGTRIFAKNPAWPMCGVNGYLLPTGMFTPAFHLQCQFARLPIKDGLPHYKSAPAMFGGSDEVVDW